MAMAMRMLMTLANGDGAAQGTGSCKLWKLWKLHATACCHQCLLAEYYYDGACCFTANGRLILSFVQSQWGSATHWEWKTKEESAGKATYLASQPGNCPDCRQSCLCLCCCHCYCFCSSCTEYFCILCVVSRAIFFLFLSYSLPTMSRPLFLFILSFCFRCISYAFRLLAFPLQVASQWRKKAAQCWHFTIHARRNWQRVTHFPACPQCCIPSESNNLQRKYPFPLLHKYICSSTSLCVFAGIYIKSTVQWKAFCHNGSENRMTT